MEDKVIVIVGPTGVGKTGLSVKLAKELNGEIISGDSVQVYKKLNIGSAKVTENEMAGVPHHLVDFLEIGDSYSVADFQREVRSKIEEITSRGKLPIICGGTGLYIKAALYNYEFAGDERDRDEEIKYEALSNEELHEKLRKVDPVSAETFHPNNRKRVLRAINYFNQNSKPISEVINKDEPLYDSLIIGLTMDRDILYERINKRVDIMLEEGLLTEVKSLYPLKEKIKAIGYNEIFKYMDKEYTLDEAIEHVKRNSRRYAKRQYTWFNNQMQTNWIDVTDKDVDFALDMAKNIIKEIDFLK